MTETAPTNSSENIVPFKERAERVLKQRIELLDARLQHLEALNGLSFTNKIWVEKEIDTAREGLERATYTLRRLFGIPATVRDLSNSDFYIFSDEKIAAIDSQLHTLNQELERVSARLLDPAKTQEEKLGAYNVFASLLTQIAHVEEERGRFLSFVEGTATE